MVSTPIAWATNAKSSKIRQESETEKKERERAAREHNNLTRCRLITLPAEIRNAIWENSANPMRWWDVSADNLVHPRALLEPAALDFEKSNHSSTPTIS
ncbi:uncharacterized protein LTR77_010817 [Saxophila tyrrhenica]|uniref:Uncharacterized protein n=1 Tax=Saxophila tyrrhenica TaxID=1690608 RepID=A0AAV9NXY5_9PEZI|nr:hypothetical protein LTR77_010817 [Saxophila tyrrhenica]